MQSVDLMSRHYDRTTIVLHWLTAALVTAQWLGAQVIDWFPSGPLRVDARSVHITGGVVLTALLAGRLLWRATRGRRLPPADRAALHVVAKATHWGLYVLLVAMVMVGLALVWARGDSIFNLFRIPPYDPTSRALAHRLEGLHATIGWVIVAGVGLHAAAALAHHYVWRDRVLGRMLSRG